MITTKRKAPEGVVDVRKKKQKNAPSTMKYLSATEQRVMFAPVAFPPTQANTLTQVVKTAATQLGVPQEDIDDVIAHVTTIQNRVDWPTIGSVLRNSNQILRTLGTHEQQHPLYFLTQFISPAQIEPGIMVDRAIASSVNIGHKLLGGPYGPSGNSELKSLDEIDNRFKKIDSAASEISERLLQRMPAFSRETPEHVEALTRALFKLQKDILDVSSAAAEALTRETNAQTGLSQSIQVVDIDEIPVTLSYARDFLREPIKTNTLETPCVRGGDCLCLSSSMKKHMRSFYSPSKWEEIVRSKTPPALPTPCLYCSIVIVCLYYTLCQQYGIEIPSFQLATYKFSVGDGPDQFRSSLMLPEIKYGIFAPFLNVCAVNFVVCKKLVSHEGNKFNVQAFDFADFR